MPLLSAHWMTEKDLRQHCRQTQLFGLLPLFLAVTLMTAPGSARAPGLWCALGVTTGLEIILWGCFVLHFREGPQTALGKRIISRSDRWFPLLLFVMRHLFLVLPVLLLWLTIVGIGFPASFFSHVAVFALLALWPAKALAHEAAITYPSDKHDLVDEFLRGLIISVMVLLIALTITLSTMPKVGPVKDELMALFIILWVGALLTVMGSQVIFIHHFIRLRGKPRSPKVEPQSSVY